MPELDVAERDEPGSGRRIALATYADYDAFVYRLPKFIADVTRRWEERIQLTFHLKRGPAQADLPGTARVITDDAERRAIAEWIVANAWTNQDVDKMTDWSPMIEVTIPDLAA